MCINPNAELELKTPKANLHLEVQNIAIEMTKTQVTRETTRWEKWWHCQVRQPGRRDSQVTRRCFRSTFNSGFKNNNRVFSSVLCRFCWWAVVFSLSVLWSSLSLCCGSLSLCVVVPSVLLQYLTMVELLESIDCMVKNAPYRKFRPDVPVHNNPKLWSVQHRAYCQRENKKSFFRVWPWNKSDVLGVLAPPTGCRVHYSLNMNRHQVWTCKACPEGGARGNNMGSIKSVNKMWLAAQSYFSNWILNYQIKIYFWKWNWASFSLTIWSIWRKKKPKYQIFKYQPKIQVKILKI